MQDYLRYAEENRDELPLYVFDKRFVEKCPKLGEEYEVPKVFPVRSVLRTELQRTDYMLQEKRSTCLFGAKKKSASKPQREYMPYFLCPDKSAWSWERFE